MSSPTNLPAKFFDLLSECQGLTLKLWANQVCKAIFHRRLTSMYQTSPGDEGYTRQYGSARVRICNREPAVYTQN